LVTEHLRMTDAQERHLLTLTAWPH
jgi:hypothetical protein